MDLRKYLNRFLFFIIILVPCIAFSQVLLKADKTDDTYELVRSKGFKLEVPDCVHPVKHVSEVWNDQLNEYVFEFDSHVNLDNDRCRNFDRERTELTITDSVPPACLAAHDGDTFTYSWKFKLDSNFIANPSFCHIHQIKAVGGDDGAPIITLTTRTGTPDMLQLIFSPAKGSGGGGTLKEAVLSQFKGVWIEALETVTYNVHGQYSIILKRIGDSNTIFSYINNDIGLSRSGAYFYRPKIGIYRSLKNKSEIRDESALFADFGITKGSVPCKDPEINNLSPTVPSEISAITLSNSQIVVKWHDNSYNEDHFRIERSLNGTDWSLAVIIISGWERWSPQTLLLSYIDSSLLSATKYYYRVKAENLYGSSDYSDSSSAITASATSVDLEKNIPDEFILQCYPNPFNPSTQISYQIPVAANVQLAIYDSLGRKITTVVKVFQSIGKYNYTFNAKDDAGNQLPNGTYFARLQAGNYVRVLKLSLLK